MRLPRPFCALSLVLGLLAAPGAHAVTATGLSSFEAIEEPLVRYYPAEKKFVPDDFINITDQGDGTFRMTDRFNAEWWDGDRDTTNADRQRAEVKGLGPHQFHGDTFIYTTTWRTNPDFHGTAGFCHIFQLKAINGDSGAPLVTISIRGNKISVEANRVGPKIVAREFPWKPGVWQTVRLRLRTSRDPDGELSVSVDGDAFQGRTGIELSRPESTEYRPKWGFYRHAVAGAKMGDDYLEHREVTAQKIAGASLLPSAATANTVNNTALETEARLIAKKSSPLAALKWLQSQPASSARDFALASLAALWAETDPAAAMAWAEKLPPGPLRDDALGRIFARWTDRDVTAAANWLHANAPHPNLDALVWLFVTDTTYRYVNRSIALDACPLIRDSYLRSKAFEHVVEIWARTQRAAAANFVLQCPSLNEGQKNRILSKIAPPPDKPGAPSASGAKNENE